jgi:hypothetical protein
LRSQPSRAPPVSHDAASRTYEYRITESPLPIAGYVSKLEIRV